MAMTKEEAAHNSLVSLDACEALIQLTIAAIGKVEEPLTRGVVAALRAMQGHLDALGSNLEVLEPSTEG